MHALQDWNTPGSYLPSQMAGLLLGKPASNFDWHDLNGNIKNVSIHQASTNQQERLNCHEKKAMTYSYKTVSVPVPFAWAPSNT